MLDSVESVLEMALRSLASRPFASALSQYKAEAKGLLARLGCTLVWAERTKTLAERTQRSAQFHKANKHCSSMLGLNMEYMSSHPLSEPSPYLSSTVERDI